jgi:hypothetical protein
MPTSARSILVVGYRSWLKPQHTWRHVILAPHLERKQPRSVAKMNGFCTSQAAMNPSPTTNSCKRHQFPAQIISHGVWLYGRFCLSPRDIEELMAERGVLRKLRSHALSVPEVWASLR